VYLSAATLTTTTSHLNESCVPKVRNGEAGQAGVVVQEGKLARASCASSNARDGHMVDDVGKGGGVTVKVVDEVVGVVVRVSTEASCWLVACCWPRMASRSALICLLSAARSRTSAVSSPTACSRSPNCWFFLWSTAALLLLVLGSRLLFLNAAVVGGVVEEEGDGGASEHRCE
jgi:hypothetical protein